MPLPALGGGFLPSFISGRRSRRGRREIGLPYPTRADGEPEGECRRHLQWQRPIEERGMLTGRTILVAEDEPLIRLDLTAALVGVGAVVCPSPMPVKRSVSPPRPI